MKNEIDLKALWQMKNAIPPDASVIVEKMNQYQQKFKRKIIVLNLILICTCVFIAMIWYYFQPKMLTTKIGIIVCILTMFIYLLVFNQLLPMMTRMSIQKSNADYLTNLIGIQRKQLFLKNVMMKFYFLGLTLGLFLYFYEYTMRSTTALILAYGITGLWIAMNWFYFLPKGFKKEELKVKDLIDLLRKTQSSF